MQGGRGRGHPFFGFGDPSFGFGSMPSLFGGRDPFDDPFFTHPPGGMLQPSPFVHVGSPFMGLNHSGSSLFGPNESPFMDRDVPRFHDRRGQSRGPIIEELNCEDEKEPEAWNSKKDNANNHGRFPRQPYVEQSYDGTEGRDLNQTQHGNQFRAMHDIHSRPQAHSFTFQSSTVTYGGSNGTYYTSSTTRRAGSDGLRFEEHKEADSVTGQAAHRISRGIHDKGHTLSRRLKSNGQVDAMQMLHNINEDELISFEEAWKGKARKNLPGWTGATNAHDVGFEGSGGRALPSTENTHASGRRQPRADEIGQPWRH